MRPLVRAVAIVLLVGVVFGLGVHYEATDDDRLPYPESEALATDYGAHVGETTLVFGTVRTFDNATGTVPIDVESDEGSFTLAVHGFDSALGSGESVQPGGTVQVYGQLGSNRTIDASEVAVVNRSGSSTTYKYAVSAVGAVLVLALFFSRWRVDRDALALEVREDG